MNSMREQMTRGQDVIRNKIRELEQNGNDLSQKDRNVLTNLGGERDVCGE